MYQSNYLKQVKSQVKENAWQLNQNISPIVVLSFRTAKQWICLMFQCSLEFLEQEDMAINCYFLNNSIPLLSKMLTPVVFKALEIQS